MDVVAKALEGKGGDMNTNEADDDDIKSVMAACVGTSSPTKRNNKKTKDASSKVKNGTASKNTVDTFSLSFSPGQTKLTSFLNVSVDDDFKDPRGMSKRTKRTKPLVCASKSMEDVLNDAQDKRDRLQVSMLQSKGKKRKICEKESREDRKMAVIASKCGKGSRGKEKECGKSKGVSTSKYFDGKTAVRPQIVILDSSSDDDVTAKPVENTDCGSRSFKKLKSLSSEPSTSILTSDIGIVPIDTEMDEDKDDCLEISAFESSDFFATDSTHLDGTKIDLNDATEVWTSTHKSSDTDPIESPELPISAPPVPPSLLSEPTPSRDIEHGQEDEPTPSRDIELRPEEEPAPSRSLEPGSQEEPTPSQEEHTPSQEEHTPSQEEDLLPVPCSLETEDSGGESDMDLFTDRDTTCISFSVSAHTDRIYFYDYSGW